jgi:hypothetical protein
MSRHRNRMADDGFSSGASAAVAEAPEPRPGILPLEQAPASEAQGDETTEASARSCGSCKAFRLSVPRKGHKQGECHRHPRVPVMAPGGVVYVYPEQDRADDCEEFLASE